MVVYLLLNIGYYLIPVDLTFAPVTISSIISSMVHRARVAVAIKLGLGLGFGFGCALGIVMGRVLIKRIWLV